MATPPLPPGFQLEGDSASGVPPLPPGFQLEGAGGPEPYRASDDMSTFDRIRAMYGRGVAELGQGIKQGALHAGGTLGLADPETVQAYDRSVAEDARLYNKDLGQRTGGSVLPMAAQIISTAPIGAAEAALVKGAPALAQIASSAGMGAAMGAAQPVTEGDYGSTKALQVGLGGALGGGANAGAKALGHAVEAATNPVAATLNPFIKNANATPFAQESERLAQETGVKLTPAQVSGSGAANMAENAARQSIFSRDIAATGDKARTQQAFDYFQKVMDGVSKSDASPDIAGKQVQGAAQSLVKSLEKARNDAATADFGAVRLMAKGAPLIRTDGYSAALAGLRDEFGGAPKGSDYARLDSAIGDLMEGVKSQGDVNNLMKTRRFLSQVAGGQVNIAPDTARGAQKMVATRLLGAIDQDIDNAAQTIGGDLGQALGTANKRYRDFSQQIDSVHASPLGNILGQDVAGAFQSGNFNTVSPEAVIGKLSSLKPTELGVVRGLMEKQQPEAWQTFKRAYLEQALEKSQAMPATAGANTPVMRPSALVKNLGEAKKLEAIFSPEEVSQLNNLTGVARRLADTTGYNFSGTAPMNEVLGLANDLSGSVTGWQAAMKAGSKLGATAFGSRQIANMMTNADGRAALIKLQQLPPGSAQARQLTAWLAANYGAQEP